MGRIAFFLPDMRSGGAERVTLDLVRGCLERGHEVDVVLLSAQGDLLSLLPPQARRVDLQAKRILAALFPLRAYLRRRKPDALIAAMWPLTVIAVLATRLLGHRPRLLLADHATLSRQYAHAPRKLAWTIAAAYPFADAIVGVSDGVCADVARLGRLKRNTLRTIHNPVRAAPLSSETVCWPGKGPRILSVGNLKPEKNHALLIAAFAYLARVSEAVLVIIGEGPERTALESRIAAEGLAGRVYLPGATLYPGDWYAQADLFVLSSDSEGFALVLVEALHAGLPIVATDCPSGSAEVLGHGRWGRLTPVGDVEALAQAMTQALTEGADTADVIAARREHARSFAGEDAVSAYLSSLDLA